ncbi:hypothetical protein F2Q68_00035440 [Brassica cretica]|uniref:Uncharacterized protein n=1 Tax=Brassica cretica TaxID=69181 RepID=A0A8S9H8W3_BRACR|nr:hypothetical protein F2Q68_00035440 [Brassica cretica]
MRFRSVVEFVSPWSPDKTCKVGQRRVNLLKTFLSPASVCHSFIRHLKERCRRLVAREKFCFLVSCDGSLPAGIVPALACLCGVCVGLLSLFSSRVVRVGLAEVIRRVVGAVIAYRFSDSVFVGLELTPPLLQMGYLNKNDRVAVGEELSYMEKSLS